ncbi:MAG: VCBS repeat domain-containing M23 family metallopeptidase [Candidatus Komeilibacteria bacterium]|nr:VCBS repeat domain-containing M23 family metallopeptidase [Candidatus Komeilibacteria bacterium]
MRKNLILLAFLATTLILPSSAARADEVKTITFPILGSHTVNDNFGAPRAGDRQHEGIDIFAPKKTPLVAAVDGQISYVPYPEASWGYAVTIRAEDGFTYHYLHLNNDNPGTDDGRGGGMHAYAPYTERGNEVKTGQLIGYIGDSGNAETTPPHLHFEIRRSDRAPINPYNSLKQATVVHSFTPSPIQDNEIVPYGNDFLGGTYIAFAEDNNLNEKIIITGAGRGGGPHIRIFGAERQPLGGFMAYDDRFRGGVDVALGDIDGNGSLEIITAPGQGGGPHIRIFDKKGNVLNQFMAYNPAWRGGVNIAAADLDGDGKAEIITGAGAGGGPHVRVFNADGQLLTEVFAYAAGFRGGVDVAAVPAGLLTKGFVITSPGQGGGPHIRVFNNDLQLNSEFMAYAPEARFGVRLSAAKSTSYGIKIMTMPASNGGPHLRIFSPTGLVIDEGYAWEEWWRGGYDIAATTEGDIITSILAGQRRAAVKINDQTGSFWQSFTEWWR